MTFIDGIVGESERAAARRACSIAPEIWRVRDAIIDMVYGDTLDQVRLDAEIGRPVIDMLCQIACNLESWGRRTGQEIYNLSIIKNIMADYPPVADALEEIIQKLKEEE